MTTHKIMVVDDNAATRRMVRNALTRQGYSVIEAPDGATARLMMAQEQPEVVLQDLQLPDADGFQLVGELRGLARGSNVSILAFSGFVQQGDEERATTVGFDDIITKPITPARLVPLVEAHLSSAPAPGDDRFGNGQRLVVADDDPLQLKLATFRLQRLGFEVEAVGNGQLVLDAIRRQLPTAVVSDVMMPELDGFGLAIAIRQDPRLRELPLVLVTSSYVDPSDRELARRAGASELVLRTPELGELVTVLRTTLADRPRQTRPSAEELPRLEADRNRRVARQLERQVQLNTGLAKRCSALASELTVLAGISETVLRHRDLDGALDDALAQCFDAGGISIGALFLLGGDGKLRARPLGGDAAWSAEDLRTLAGPTPFFGHEAVLHAVLASGKSRYVSLADATTLADVLARCRATALYLIPLIQLGEPLGVLMMGSQRRDIEEDDWRAFAMGVGNQMSQVLSLARAYTAREHAEARAKQQAAVLEAIVDSAPDTVLHVDLDGKIQLINRMPSGEPAHAVVGSDWLQWGPPETRDTLRKALDEVRAGNATGYEVQGWPQAGAPRWYSARLGPIKDGDRVVGAVVVARDVTDRKQTEMQLMVSDRMASVGTLAAGVAHEINNPLASVIANLDMALADVAQLGETTELPAELADEIRDARHAADRVRQIVRDLKIFSRAEEDSRGPVDVEHVLDSTLRMAWNELRHRAKVVKSYGGVRPVDANDSRLGQVFLNLIVNAVHALPERNYAHNEIRLKTELQPGNRVLVTISDTGNGIPAEIQQRLFTPFFTTKPAGVGTGLGLAISHRIVASFGGTLTFESEVGKGTSFFVSLPVARGESSQVKLPTLAPVTSVRRGKVLVVDDEETIAMTMKRSLSGQHDVTTLTSARAAIELLASGQRYDVILCDLMMPEVTGMELYADTQRIDGDQAKKIVFVTGGAFTIAAREFLDVVPNRRLEKPFDLRTLRELVSELLR
jgi:PAS domain S-box-containing protein